MNELQVFSGPTTAELRQKYPYDKNSFLGYFYFLEYGNEVKIGSTNNPANRYSALLRSASNYGNVKLGALAVSQAHTNYRENELLLHRFFRAHRRSSTEFFSLSFEDALTLFSSVVLEYRDDTEEINRRADLVCDGLKKVTGLGQAAENLTRNIPNRTVATCGDDAQEYHDATTGASVRIKRNPDGSLSINAEDAAIGLGWTQTKSGKLYVKWERLNQFCAGLGFSPNVGKGDYIPESLFYMLAMKANNDTALYFQKWIAFDVVPSIRKTGGYTVPSGATAAETAETERRILTPDDYLTAARILSGCRNERLPYVVGLIKKAGIEISLETRLVSPRSTERDLSTAKLLNRAFDEYGLSIRALERATGIYSTQFYRIRQGKSFPTPERAALIRDAIARLVPEMDLDEEN